MKRIIKKAGTFLRVLFKEGPLVLMHTSVQVLERDRGENYNIWIKEKEKSITETLELSHKPKISVVVPVYNVETAMLKDCIESVLNQTYDNWELCIADDCSTMESVKNCLKEYEDNEKIKIVYREKNGHISLCTNSAIELADGEYIAFMDCDDTLSPNALYEVACKLNEDNTLDFIYSDEDKIDENGKRRHEPHFKPEWSPDTYMSLNYTCHLGVYRKSIGDEIGWLRKGYEGAQDYDFTLRFTEKTDRIGHIPKILYHWRQRAESTAVNPEAKGYILETAKRAKEDALSRRNIQGEVEYISEIYQYRVNYACAGNPLVSVIIPSKDNFEVFKRCVDSLREITEYDNYEIVLVDNGSSEEQMERYAAYCKKYAYTYVYKEKEFNFSFMCNLGAAHANGELYLFLNDDITIKEGKWMERMAGHAMQSHVGAVGAKLLYPDTTLIQHVGVISFVAGPVHSLCQMDDTPIYYFCRNKIEYNYSAVTAACLMVDKKKFEEIGGFDESYAVAYNDIDLCFKLFEKGYYNVARMDAVLYHHESLSRGSDTISPEKMKRLIKERERLYSAHPQFNAYDPFYSPNLTMEKGDFSLSIKTKGSYGNVHKVSADSFKAGRSDAFKYHIGLLSVREPSVNISGWCFDDNKKYNNISKVYVILKGRKNCYIADTDKEYSKDFNLYSEKNRNVSLCGFKCRIAMSEIDEGEYKLCLVKGGMLYETDQSVYIGN